MDMYGQLLNIAMPIFLFFFFVEAAFVWRRKLGYVSSLDSVSSLSSGMTNVLKDVLGLAVSILSYQWLVGHISFFEWPQPTWWMYLVGFIAVDFQSYWVHRWSHEINFLWNRHVIHHSSEEYNLACALRQSVSVFANYFAFLLIPAAFLGVPPQIIAIIAPLHLFLQYWYHTRLIGRMGWLEQILMTPSHHRVHHAINEVYLDKNYAAIFILWDKWFGTFQEELPGHEPVYGIKRPAQTWNPLRINFQHFALLLRDAIYTRHWFDKLRLWFMPTGWRPADVAARFPVEVITDVHNFKKYTGSDHIPLLHVWSWVQLFVTYILLTYFFAHMADIAPTHALLYAGILFFMVWSFTELMDGRVYAVYLEWTKCALIVGWVVYQGHWFDAHGYWAWLNICVPLYQVVSAIAVGMIGRQMNTKAGFTSKYALSN